MHQSKIPCDLSHGLFKILTKVRNLIKSASFYIEVRKKRDEFLISKSCNKTLNSR